VRLVGVPHHLGCLARQSRTEDGLAERGPRRARTEVVGGAADDDLELPRGVGGEELLGHCCAGRGLGRGGVGGHRLDQALSSRRAVGVQVVEDDEPRVG
jgi:hypothetical protein